MNKTHCSWTVHEHVQISGQNLNKTWTSWIWTSSWTCSWTTNHEQNLNKLNLNKFMNMFMDKLNCYEHMIKKIEENKKICKFFKNKFLEGERHRDWRRGKKVQRYKTKDWHRLLLQVSHVMLQRRTVHTCVRCWSNIGSRTWIHQPSALSWACTCTNCTWQQNSRSVNALFHVIRLHAFLRCAFACHDLACFQWHCIFPSSLHVAHDAYLLEDSASVHQVPDCRSRWRLRGHALRSVCAHFQRH